MPALLAPDLTRTATAPARWSWTPARRAAFLDRYEGGATDTAIAREFGCHQTTVLLHRRRLGLEPNCPQGSLARTAARTALRPGWGLCGGVTASPHYQALKLAGWSWPLFHPNGDVVDLPPVCVRLLLVLLRDGPQTRRQLVEAVGLAYKVDGCQLNVGHPSRDALVVLRSRGLIERAGRTRRPGPSGGIPADLFAVTDAGAAVLAEAARGVPEADGVTLRPADVLAMCGLDGSSGNTVPTDDADGC